jgi:hypothetical protein
MADGRLRVIGVPASGSGLKRALAKYVKDGTVVTSFDDAKLKALQQLCPDDVDAEFPPFGDLVGRFLTMLGEPIARLCPRGQLQAAVEFACKDLPADSPMAESSNYPGTSELITERLAELRDWGVTSEELGELAESASPSLGEKLRSLLAVDTDVRRVLEETNRQFASTRVERCLAVPPAIDVPIKRVVLAVAGEEKPLYETWLQWIAGFGIEVIVLVDRVPGADHLFGVSARCAERMRAKIEDGKEEHWCASLFTDQTAKDPPDVVIVDTADPLSEAEWAIRGCLAQMSAGVLPHRIAVFARNADEYAPLLLASAERHGVPVSAATTAPLLTNGFAALVLGCLEALAGNDVRALGRLAHSSYLRSDLEKNAELIEATRAAFVQGENQWSAMNDWAASHGDEFAWLRAVLTWREQAVASRTGVSGWWRRMHELVAATQIVDASIEAAGDTALRDNNAQTVLLRSINDHAFVYDRSGRPELSLSGFVRTARALWENETVAIPPRPNGVVLVSNTSALTAYEVLFVVGMLEGTLPRRRSEDPILFDTERQELSLLLCRPWRLPDSRDRAAAERDEFVRICSAASKRLVFSFPQTDDERDNVPAFYLEEVARACPKTERSPRPRSQFVPSLEECASRADEVVRKALDAPRAAIEPPLLTTEIAKNAVRPVFEQGVAPEELSRALVCPFQSTARHRLRLFAPARRRLMRSLRDLPTDLATSPNPVEAKKRLDRAIDEYLQRMYPEFEPWELAMLGSAARRLAEEWVEREFRARKLWREEGEETHPQVALDEHGLKNELRVGDKNVKLRGKAAALTLRKGYSVLRFYDAATPELMEVTEVPKDNEHAFLYGIYLMAQLHLSSRNPCVEVDGMDGKRVLAGFKDIRRSLPHDPASGIEVVRVSDSRDVFFQNVKARMKEAVEVLDRADMRAIPGRQCEPCQYGELCRVSSVFGETDDPFAEEGE